MMSSGQIELHSCCWTCILALATLTWGQSPQAGPAPAGADAPPGLPMADIEKLVAPIALYPDVLVSQILPAATFPTDIVMASRWIKEHPDLKDLDAQKWDLSVLSVCRYPQVLDKLNADLDWTNSLGAAFMDQPDDVMAAIQNLRRSAQASGALQDTPQQSVVMEQQTVRIVPAEKEVVYVPQYDPQVVYAPTNDSGVSAAAAVTASAISFGAGVALGAWLDNDCDWVHGCVVGCRPGYWGGWGYHGAVARWDNDWAAARGPRRGVIAGENGGAYVGPRGAAVWGDNGHGAAWRRPAGYPRPTYSGRYSGYNNVAGNHRNVAAGNQINVNRNNVNIDRGDRTNIGNTSNRIGDNNRNASAGDRYNSSFADRGNANDLGRQRDRGSQSRESYRQDKPAQQPGRFDSDRARPQQSRPQPSQQSAFGNSSRGGGDTRAFSSRGSSSRGGGGMRSGGSRGGRGR